MKLGSAACDLIMYGHQMRAIADALDSVRFCEQVLTKLENDAATPPMSITLEAAQAQHRNAVQRLLSAVS